MSLTVHPSPTGLATRFAQIALGLCGVLATMLALLAPGAQQAALLRVRQRIMRLNELVARLSARLALGQAVARAARRPGGPRAKGGGQRARVSSARGWLIRLGYRVVPYGTYLTQLLDDPEMLALLAAAPQLKGALRSLLRMLLPADQTMPAAVAVPPRVRPPPAPEVVAARMAAREARRAERRSLRALRREIMNYRPGPIRPVPERLRKLAEGRA